MKTIIIIAIYGACAFFLWKQEKLIPRSLLISMFIFFVLIISSEILIIVNQYYNIGVFTYLVTVCALYNLYNTQIQYCILYRNHFRPNKDDLHSFNALLMNKHLSFKNKEVDYLRTQIETNNKLYKTLLEFFPGAFLISCNDKIAYVNSAGLSLLETENYDDVINQPIWNFIHPDYISFIRLNYASLEPTNNNVIVNNIKILSMNNEVKEVEVSSTPAYLDDTYYIISSVRDLTERNQQEHLQLELEKAIAHEKSKVEFFANISHDLKTPVNVIYSAIQLQDIYVQSSDFNKIQMYNNVIKQNCLRLQKLLNDLLDITRIDANHFSVRLKLCNVISLIENITQSVTAYVEHKNISIIFDTNIEEKFTMTDPDLIERIILNLLSNAIKYGKENGHIWVTLNAQDDHLVASIKDDGIGIPKDQLSNIFERFIKAKNNSPSRGSGIGLSLVKAIIEILGGTISCISQENEGTEFIIHLPTIPCYDQNTTHAFVDSLEIDDQLNIELSNI